MANSIIHIFLEYPLTNLCVTWLIVKPPFTLSSESVARSQHCGKLQYIFSGKHRYKNCTHHVQFADCFAWLPLLSR